MTIYKIEQSDLNQLYKDNSQINNFSTIISEFLHHKKIYTTNKNTFRQHKINLILSMNEYDMFYIIILWFIIIFIIFIYLTII